MKRQERQTLMRARATLRAQYQSLCEISNEWDFDANGDHIPESKRSPDCRALHRAIDSTSVAIQHVNRLLGFDPNS